MQFIDDNKQVTSSLWKTLVAMASKVEDYNKLLFFQGMEEEGASDVIILASSGSED